MERNDSQDDKMNQYIGFGGIGGSLTGILLLLGVVYWWSLGILWAFYWPIILTVVLVLQAVFLFVMKDKGKILQPILFVVFYIALFLTWYMATYQKFYFIAIDISGSSNADATIKALQATYETLKPGRQISVFILPTATAGMSTEECDSKKIADAFEKATITEGANKKFSHLTIDLVAFNMKDDVKDKVIGVLKSQRFTGKMAAGCVFVKTNFTDTQLAEQIKASKPEWDEFVTKNKK